MTILVNSFEIFSNTPNKAKAEPQIPLKNNSKPALANTDLRQMALSELAPDML